MCGDHSIDGGAHHGAVPRPVFRPRPQTRSRRQFLGDVGRSAVAVAVVTPVVLAACGGDDDAASADGGASVATGTDDEANALRWARVNLDFVSAYVLARGNTAAIIDTGVAGSAPAIGESLRGLGLNYSDVDHVVLTHHHADHAGSIDAVVAEAINATVYAGEADLTDLGGAGGEITGVVGGEDVFGFEMLATPGHTAGHMSVIDHEAGVLVAGDAFWSMDGGVAEGPERFFSDVAQSRQTISALANLSFETVLLGHGEPIEAGADRAVAALAASFA